MYIFLLYINYIWNIKKVVGKVQDKAISDL